MPQVQPDPQVRLVPGDQPDLPVPRDQQEPTELPDRPDAQELTAGVDELADAVRNLTRHVRSVRDEIRSERVDRRRSIRRAVLTGLACVMVLAAGIALGASVAFGRIDARVDRNSHLIAVTQYEQCQIRNAGTRRQNMLIDSAIAAEKRRPQPDPKRLQDLENFKGATPDCGPKP